MDILPGVRGILVRICASGLVLGALLLATAPALAADTNPADSAHTIEQIAAQLERDPIFIQQVAGGGDVAQARQVAADVAEGVPGRVFVVAGSLPIGSSSEAPRTFAFDLHRLIGGEATYAIAALDGTATVVSFGDSAPEGARNYDDTQRVMKEKLERFPDHFDPRSGNGPEWSAVRLTRLAQVLIKLHGLGDSEMTGGEVDELAGHRFLHVMTRDPDEPTGSTWGRQWMFGTLVFLLVLVWLPGVLRLLSKRSARRRTEALPARRGKPDWAVGAELEQLLAELSDRLARLDPGRVRRPELYDVALAAKEAADTRGDSDVQTERLGALTLARHGLHAAKLADSTRAYVAWRPCFINPLHGRATEVRQWVFGDAEIRVPLCRACAIRLDGARPPEPLLVAKGRRSVPYFELEDVWGRTGYGALTDDYPRDVLRDGGAR